jgi:Tfp pilus assembly protein PilN
VRPVNLIPGEQRTERRGLPGGGRTGAAVYAPFAILVFALVAVMALVLTSNRINDRKDSINGLKRDQQASEAAANALRPYGNFAQMQRARVSTVRSLVGTSFNWDRMIRSLARTIPSNVWLVSFKGTVDPNVQMSEGTAEGVGELRGSTQSPAIELVGCTYSHPSVARMMARMRNMDNVTEVALKDSEKSQATAQSSTGSTTTGGGQDCRTKKNITKFHLLIVLGAAQVSAAGAAATPASPVAQAQAAASAASQGSSPSVTGAGP